MQYIVIDFANVAFFPDTAKCFATFLSENMQDEQQGE